jgi:predicted secreted protein
MKTKSFLILISIFIGIEVYSQDTVNYVIQGSTNNFPLGYNFNYIGDTLTIYGTILVICGTDLAVISRKDDTISISLPKPPICNLAEPEYFEIKLNILNSDKIVNFFGEIYNLQEKNPVEICGDTSYYNTLLGDTIQLNLNSNPSTGYEWIWTNKQSPSIVDTIGFNYIADTPILIGSGGKEIWKFQGEKIGIDTIKLEYCQPWDSNSTIETRIIIVKVMDPNVISGLSNDIIGVYPNPTTGLLNIEFQEASVKGYLFEIYDLNGVKILNRNLNSSKEVINLATYKPGFYTLSVVYNNNVIFRKLILKR